MTRNIYIIILTVFLTNPVFSQDTLFKINGKVIDDITKQPIKSVSVQINGTLKGTATDSNGLFKLSVKEKDLILIFSITGYDSKSIKANYKSYSKLVIELSQKTEVLNEVVINASPIENVIKNKNSNVLDYDFYRDNILLITYRNDLSKSKLILINQSFDTISKINIPGEPTGLFKDCLGNNYIVCENSIYQIYLDSFNLRLFPAQTIENFETILYPCVAEDSLNLYLIKKYGAQPVETGFHVFNSPSHTINYSYVNKSTKKKSNLVDIVDEEMIRKRKDELRFEKSKQASGMYEHGSPGQDRLFFETIVIKEVYAPLYNIKDKIYIFDYIDSCILKYSSNGQLINKVEIKFQNDKHWKRQMCVDEKSGKAFAVFETNGITELKEINLTNGQINQSYKIPFVFVKNIKAQDNYIYF
ncbi:MAG: carboxypeptidase-like regulatory domain-containing protein, partial [Bacteroidia bacterium]